MTKRILCFAPRYNTEGKYDATGAFQPEARGFAKALFARGEVSLALFDNAKSMVQRRADVTAVIKRSRDETGARPWTDLAFFCHGWGAGIQAGFRRQDAGLLAALAYDLCGSPITLTVALYCCSTGQDMPETNVSAAGTGDNSFADCLRDALCRRGATHARVMAHSTVAHTTTNPNARFFDGMGSAVGGAGGYAVVSPKSGLWPLWKAQLKTGTLRFRFPFMSVAEIHAELTSQTKTV